MGESGGQVGENQGFCRGGIAGVRVVFGREMGLTNGLTLGYLIKRGMWAEGLWLGLRIILGFICLFCKFKTTRTFHVKLKFQGLQM